MLPLDLTIDNYAQNKVAYLPRKLKEEGAGPFNNEQAGDLCYFVPWEFGLFYAGYRWSSGSFASGVSRMGMSRCWRAANSCYGLNATDNKQAEFVMQIVRAGANPSGKSPVDWFTGAGRKPNPLPSAVRPSSVTWNGLAVA